MNLKRWFGLLLLALGTFSGAHPASAQTVIGNTSGATNNQIYNLHSTAWMATTAFTMGATAQTLTGARLVVSVIDDALPIVELRANNAGNPGAVVASFTNPTVNSSPTLRTFTPTAPYTLAASTTYWLTFRAVNSSQTNWHGSNPGVTPTGPFATAVNGGGGRISFNSGASWLNFTHTPTYEILGTPAGDAPAVPEPASALLFLPALAVVGLLKRRRG